MFKYFSFLDPKDPLIRMTREVAPKLGYIKPAVIYSTFLPSLQGVQTKMSASDARSCVFLDYNKKRVKKIVRNNFLYCLLIP